MTGPAGTEAAPRWAVALHRAASRLSTGLPGGPRPLRLATLINLQKGATGPFVLGLMWAYDVWTAAAWAYLAIHGAYGACWLIKDRAFPDRRWEARITLGGAALTFAGVLGLYWVLPWLLLSGAAGPPERPGWLLAVAVAAHTVGLALMLGADAQKYFTLRLRPGLVTDGFYARTRNPNYLGEMILYGSYALVVRHWAAWAILAWVWLGLFLPSMLVKDASLSRHPGWHAWKARTGLLLPRLGRPAAGAALPAGGPPPAT